MTQAEEIAMHVAIGDEGVRPGPRPLEHLLDPLAVAELERNEENRHRRWLDSIKNKTVETAAADVNARGNALLIWIDTNGEMRARRISREDSVIREFVPAYLRRQQ